MSQVGLRFCQRFLSALTLGDLASQVLVCLPELGGALLHPGFQLLMCLQQRLLDDATLADFAFQLPVSGPQLLRDLRARALAESAARASPPSRPTRQQ